MSVFEAISFTVGILPLIISVGGYTAARDGFKYRQERFGSIGQVLWAVRFLDTTALQRMHWNINVWTDGEVIAWKESQLSNYNATTVAAAIFAGIGLTALQLPSMFTIHWTARGLCAASMLFGILSVFFATEQYRKLSQLDDALSIRLWLSRGRPTPYLDMRLEPVKQLINFFTPTTSRDISKSNSIEASTSLSKRDKLSHRTWTREPGNMLAPKYKNVAPFDELPLESSISALKMVELPRLLLYVAVLLFLVGFGLYSLFLWLESMDGSAMSHRNVFIIVVILLGLSLSYAILVYAAKNTDDSKKTREFRIKKWTSDWNCSEEIRELEKRLDTCRKTFSLINVLQDEPPEETGSMLATTAPKSKVAGTDDPVALAEPDTC